LPALEPYLTRPITGPRPIDPSPPQTPAPWVVGIKPLAD
jgi:hypothetical protein